ncbi:uncharacterized protein LOC142332094 isoform X2 [Lycorma delicatula]|uniref:uncharacterized protein LOC142332094 isoform X2 n=1 Tax=Lycorma delicatula TaxID=130591 RepID=UPI003F51A510
MHVDTVKNKWKHLRDNFRTELKKTVRGTGNPPQPYQSQWTFFNDLLFLEEQMMKKINRTYGPFPYKLSLNTPNDSYDEYVVNNCDGIVSNSNDEENNGAEDVIRNTNFLTHSLFEDSSAQEPVTWLLENDSVNFNNTNKRKRCNYDYEQTTNSNWNKILPNHNDISDDDFHFMMSLLPYVKSLSAPRKMFIRLKIQELCCNFIYKSNSFEMNERYENKVTINKELSSENVIIKSDV